jgi:hypothetical protein
MKAGSVVRAGAVACWLAGAMADNLPSAPTPMTMIMATGASAAPTTDGAWVEYPETT